MQETQTLEAATEHPQKVRKSFIQRLIDQVVAGIGLLSAVALVIILAALLIDGGRGLTRFMIDNFTTKPVYETPEYFEDSTPAEVQLSDETTFEGGTAEQHEAILSALEGTPGEGLTIIFTEDERNCGAFDNEEGGNQGGCYQPSTPDTLYLSNGMNSEEVVYVTLHELAHYLQNTQGVPFNECEADAYAVEKTGNRAYAAYMNIFDCEPALELSRLQW